MIKVTDCLYYRFCFNCCKPDDTAMEVFFSTQDEEEQGYTITLCKKCREKLMNALHDSLTEEGQLNENAD